MSIITEHHNFDLRSPREQWIADRQTGIGASEWGMVLGISPFKTRYELALEKLGAIQPEDLSDNEDIEYGNAMESVTLSFLAKRTGRVVQAWDQNKIVRSTERAHLFCTPDALQTAEGKPGQGTVDAKNTKAWAIKDWKTEPPLAYQVQLQAQMYVMGLKWGTLCVTIGGNRFRYFDINRDDRFLAAALPAMDEFWATVQRGEMPEPDASASARNALARLYPEDTGLSAALSSEFQQHYAELKALKAAQKILETRRTGVENKVKGAIGNNTFGELPNGSKFSWKAQTKTCVCPHCQMITSESTFRVLRQHDAKDIAIDPIQERIAATTAALLQKGATLLDESASGSRYFELAGGLLIRVADHEPNEATGNWMERKEIFSIRVDSDEWQQQLEEIVGNAPDASNE